MLRNGARIFWDSAWGKLQELLFIYDLYVCGWICC